MISVRLTDTNCGEIGTSFLNFLGEGEVFSSRRRRAGKGRGNIISRTRHGKIGTRQQVFKWPSGPRLVCVASAGNAWVVALAASNWLLA